MINVIRENKRHFSDYGWLKTFWLFSFSDYYDPQNIQFGALRVFNDDVVEPGKGFPTHPHEEMEIITIVLEGKITHQDSMGNKAVIRAGEVQRMSAGTGLTHSEFNLAKAPVHFYQIWLFPDIKGLAPSYDQREFEANQWHNRLFPVASGEGRKDVVTFNTAATIYRASLDAGKELRFQAKDDRRIFIYLTAGHLRVNGQDLKKNDQARIDLEAELALTAVQDAELILIDVPSCKGWGYSKETLNGSSRS